MDMNLGALIPIIAIMASAWVIVSLIHYKQGRRGLGCQDSATSVDDARENARLARENELLRLTIERLEKRTAVLERIATDPATRTAREIEQLRHGA
jgi:2-keto-3-deoxy-L-rhamnonate aldolase RhmA